MTDDILRCCGCGNPADCDGETGCNCATGILWTRSHRDVQLLKPSALRAEATALREAADKLDVMAGKVAAEIKSRLKEAPMK